MLFAGLKFPLGFINMQLFYSIDASTEKSSHADPILSTQAKPILKEGNL